MKRIIVLMLALVLALALVGCGGSKGEAEAKAEPTAAPTEEPTATPTEEPVKEIKIDEKIVTGSYEFTLYDAQIGNWHKNLSSGGWDEKWPGDPRVVVSIKVKNLEKSEIKPKQSITCTVDYNDGYTYDCDMYYPIWQQAYSSTTLNSLKEDDIRFETKVPEEVLTNKSAPLVLIFKLWDGAEYRYTFTDDNYNPPLK